MKSIKIISYTEILKDAEIEGVVEINGCYLYTQDEIIEEQKTWDDEDSAKNFDFSVSPFWLHTPGSGEEMIKIHDATCLFEIFG